MHILIVSAHPDDAEFALGGTLLLLSKKHDVTLAVLTDGSAGSYGSAKSRRKEQETAAAYAGIDLIWQGLRDTTLEHDREHTLRVAQIIRNTKPDVILAPHWRQEGSVVEFEAHPEHRITGRLVKDAARYARFNVADLHGERHRCEDLLWYMVPPGVEAKIAVDVSAARKRLPGLWNCHKSQHRLVDGNLPDFLDAQRRKAHHGIAYAELLDADEPVSSLLLKQLLG